MRQISFDRATLNEEVRVVQVEIPRISVAPGLTAGRGLKLAAVAHASRPRRRCARPNRRARIET